MLFYPFFLLAIFLVSGVTASYAAGKWHLIAFYNLYRYEVDALGYGSNGIAPGASKNGGVADLENFARNVAPSKKLVDKRPGSSGAVIDYPDWDKVNWAAIGDGKSFDPEVFDREITKADYRGKMDNNRLFKNWSDKPSYASVMDNFEKRAVAAQQQLKKDGKVVDNDRFKAMQSALETHIDARRYDMVNAIEKKFQDFLTGKGHTVHLDPDPITHPHLPSYQKVDADATVKANDLKDDAAKEVLDWVKTNNMAGSAASHVTAITKATTVQENLAAACAPK